MKKRIHPFVGGGIYLVLFTSLFAGLNLLGLFRTPWWWTVMVGVLALPVLFFGTYRQHRKRKKDV